MKLSKYAEDMLTDDLMELMSVPEYWSARSILNHWYISTLDKWSYLTSADGMDSNQHIALGISDEKGFAVTYPFLITFSWRNRWKLRRRARALFEYLTAQSQYDRAGAASDLLSSLRKQGGGGGLGSPLRIDPA